ncbi:MAG TPA: formate dehydrogenase accessory protein FdhE [Gemmatimonadales bacterium]|jgi:FdhE protein|nr:formate dehydrogenase accessory protein FdhE [Gemmatimonadales bacterium]
MSHQARPLRGTPARLQREARARLSSLETANPEWQPLLAVVRETIADLQAREAPIWWDLRTGAGTASRETGTPLLHGASIAIDLPQAGQLVRRLGSAAALAGGQRGARLDGQQLLALFTAAAAEDVTRVAELAQQFELPAGALLVVARHALIPLLCECAVHVSAAISPSGQTGYCPSCGAWPVLAELRGLEQGRRLRCGRCATDWAGEWLCCTFCGERDHRRQGSLVPQTAAGSRVETCASCKGYLKTWATLTPLSAVELLLCDLESLELDLAARESGFSRPAELGFPLELELTEWRRSPLRRRWR